MILIAPGCKSPDTEPDQVLFYTGSSNGSISHPISLCKLDYKTFKISVVDSFKGSHGSSYLALSPDRQFMYAIDKTLWDTSSGEQRVSSFRINSASYGLEYLNSQSSKGQGPCHVFCNKDRSYIFTANYNSGSLAAFPLDENGEILPASDVYQGTGSGPNQQRQTSAHAHYVTLDRDENFLLSPDLGSDRVLIFKFDPSEGKLIPNPAQPFFQTAPGAGPRHLDFHPNGQYLYVINELNGTLTACSFQSSTGEVAEINTASTLPDDFIGFNGSAAVRVHPNGKFVYASNRGDLNSIAGFRILDDGSLERIQILTGVPDRPRDFNIDPSGKFMLVAGERSDDIELYLIDADTGELSSTGEKIRLNAPANILFIENQD